MKIKLYQWLKQIGLYLKNNLTLYEVLSLLISFAGAISLVFIFIQTMQATANMKASMYATMTIQTLEMDKILLEHPQLRPYFYEKWDPSGLTDYETRNKVTIIAEYQLDYFDLVMTQLDYIPTDQDSEEDKETWKKYFADSFANSPALCKRITDKPGWYMTKLVKIAEDNCKKPV